MLSFDSCQVFLVNYLSRKVCYVFSMYSILVAKRHISNFYPILFMLIFQSQLYFYALYDTYVSVSIVLASFHVSSIILLLFLDIMTVKNVFFCVNVTGDIS